MKRLSSAMYLGGLLLVYYGILFLDCGLTDPGRPDHFAVRIAAPLVEIGLALFLSCWLVQGEGPGARRWIRQAAAFLVPLIVGVIYISQTLTLHLSDNFVTVLALENQAEGRLVRGLAFYSTLALGLAWSLLYGWLFWRSPQVVPRKRWPVYGTFASLATFAWLVTHQENHGRLEAGYRQTPVASLLQTSFKLHTAHTLYAGGGSGSSENEIVDEAALPGGRYPFEKMTIYHRNLPFPNSARKPNAMPNVIVIFTEGLSARLVGAYGGRFPGLTPNIDRLATRTMRVDNYYNHTAATYRGLQGQLTSGYPSAGGSGESLSWDERGGELRQVRYQSLPLLLRDIGYQSYFFSPHPNSVSLNDLLRTMGFDSVFSAETALAHSDDYKTRMLGGSLNDRDVFGELTRFLKQRAENPQRRPVFIGTYNVGTHAFGSILPSGLKYADGTNMVLDRFHNYDAEFGRFLDYFLSSPYADDTILIFTADHATYPEPPFRTIAGDHYKPYFVDRVPLLIYDPFHELPPSFDAKGKTTLSLAPTILQLLGVRSGANSFLGRTLFSGRNLPFGVAAIGQEFYVTDTAGVYSEVEVPDAYRAEFERRKRVIELYYQMEMQNRVFKQVQ